MAVYDDHDYCDPSMMQLHCLGCYCFINEPPGPDQDTCGNRDHKHHAAAWDDSECVFGAQQ
jgi:hypothetical protein